MSKGFCAVVAWILLGAVLVLGIEVGYQSIVIQNQRTQIQGLVEHCLKDE